MIEVIAFYMSFVFFYSARAVKDVLLLTRERNLVPLDKQLLLSFELLALCLVSLNSYYLGVLSLPFSIYLFLAVITVFPVAYNGMYYWAIKKLGNPQGFLSIYEFPVWQRVILLTVSLASLLMMLGLNYQ